MLNLSLAAWPIRLVKELEARVGMHPNDIFRKGAQPSVETLAIVYELARRLEDPDFTAETIEKLNITYGTIVREINEALDAVALEAIATAQNPLVEAAPAPTSTDGSPRSRSSTATRRRNSGI